MTDDSTPSRRRFLALTAAATVGGFAGCSSGSEGTPESTTTEPTATRTTTDSQTPTPTTTTPEKQGYRRVERDVTFREVDGASLELDLYRPAAGDGFPFVVFAHGGGWVTGNKRERPMFDAMVRQGIAVADIQYRLAPAYRYPAAVRDTVAAVKWVRANADSYGIDAERAGLAGYSAGAHLAALVAAAPEVEAFQPTEFHPEQSAAVDALIGYSGPYDFTVAGAGENPLVANFFGPDASSATLREGSPTTHVDSADPPALLVHGTADSIVPYRSTTVMADTFREAGVSVEVITGDGAGHGMIDNPEWRERTVPAQLELLNSNL